MKVILLENVKGSGKKSDVVNVSDGYAKNYLLPRKLAIEATKAALNELNIKQNASEYKKNKLIEESKNLAEKLEAKKIIIYVKAGENGKLFGAVTAKEISDEIKKQLNLDVDRKKIVLNEQIKSLGSWVINIKLCHEVVAKLNLEILDRG
jgi:ribosomal protein L9